MATAKSTERDDSAQGKTDAQDKTNLVEVTLIDSHTHKGKKRDKGSKLWVSPRRKKWLIDHKKVAG